MRKIVATLIVSILLPIHCFAQKGLDSLNNRLQQARSAADSIELLKQIGIINLHTQIPEKENLALQYFDKAIFLAEKARERAAQRSAVIFSF